MTPPFPSPFNNNDTPQKTRRYQPQEVEIETPLKCFIPDYLPAVGEMDAFLKVGAKEGKERNTYIHTPPPSTPQASRCINNNINHKQMPRPDGLADELGLKVRYISFLYPHSKSTLVSHCIPTTRTKAHQPHPKQPKTPNQRLYRTSQPLDPKPTNPNQNNQNTTQKRSSTSPPRNNRTPACWSWSSGGSRAAEPRRHPRCVLACGWFDALMGYIPARRS